MNELDALNAEVDRLAKEAESKAIIAFQARVLADRAVVKRDTLLLTAFWEANPGIVIQMGDKLIVTAEYAALDAKVNGDAASKEGDIINVSNIEMVDNIPQFWVVDHYGVRWASLEHVRAMRQAWLDKYSDIHT